jgi:phosphoribosyl-ATP pyrophosphohydrolase/phosphoribosyl-AMP cyclohydrolase
VDARSDALRPADAPQGETSLDPDTLVWDAAGLIPAVVQDAASGEVLTLAWMNRESLARTLTSGETWFWSRSRGELWHKGATSGNTQRVVSLGADCDRDALVVRVTPRGPACHTGARSCFTAPGAESLGAALDAVVDVVARRKVERPAGSYTTYLFDAGLNKVCKKVGEEATEVIVASKDPDDDAVASEAADLLYHLTVLLAARGVGPEKVAAKLAARRGDAAPREKKPRAPGEEKS